MANPSAPATDRRPSTTGNDEVATSCDRPPPWSVLGSTGSMLGKASLRPPSQVLSRHRPWSLDVRETPTRAHSQPRSAGQPVAELDRGIHAGTVRDWRELARRSQDGTSVPYPAEAHAPSSSGCTGRRADRRRAGEGRPGLGGP